MKRSIGIMFITITLGLLSCFMGYADEPQGSAAATTSPVSESVVESAPTAAPENTLIVEEIRCAGNKNNDCAFIQKQVGFQVGEVLNEEAIENARLRLLAMPQFWSVSTHLEKGSERGKVAVVFEVSETSEIQAAVSAGVDQTIGRTGYSTHNTAVLGAGFKHQNLFGSGKSFGISTFFVDSTPTGLFRSQDFWYQSNSKEALLRLDYLDPNLLGSRDYFASVSAIYGRIGRTLSNSAYNQREIKESADEVGIDIVVGRRFGDIEYISLQYTLTEGLSSSLWDHFSEVVKLNFGWNSEDDQNFPTQGYSLELFGGLKKTKVFADFMTSEVALGLNKFRKTWALSNESFLSVTSGISSASFNYGKEAAEKNSLLSLTYARSFSESINRSFGATRSRWYFSPTVNGIAVSSGSVAIVDSGLRAGVKFETKYFGLIELYAAVNTNIGGR